MIFRELSLTGARLIELEPRCDERGFFARAWCQREFAAQGLPNNLSQINLSFNALRGTLRGMHFQRAPHAEAKIVACLRGAIYDVLLDLRTDSPTFMQWEAMELSADNRRQVFIPAGCAHGFQSLSDDTEVLYFMSEFYAPQHAAGYRYDDAAFKIDWPLPVSVISAADRDWPAFAGTAEPAPS